MVRRAAGVLRGIVVLVAALVGLALVPGCGFWEADDPPPTVVLADDFVSLLGGGDLAFFHTLARDGVTPVPPATARLVGPTYGVAFDALGTTRVFDGLTFGTQAYGLAPDDISHRSRGEHRARNGREFLLAHVPTGTHLPEPERGYGAGPLFADWQVDVGGTARKLTRNGDPGTIGTGSIIVVNVPAGGDARLGATVGDRTKWISLRTGTRFP
jgi:hypothetical protein